jgi:hypothetical protein
VPEIHISLYEPQTLALALEMAFVPNSGFSAGLHRYHSIQGVEEFADPAYRMVGESTIVAFDGAAR